MERTELLQQIAITRQALFDEGILDKHFTYLEDLEENGNPNFVEDTTGLFFRDSTKRLATIQRTMETTPVDFMKLDKCFYQLKGSSGSIGAIRVRNEVNRTRELCEQGNLEAAKVAFQQLRNEHEILRTRLDSYLQLVREAESGSETSES
ncbi:pseudo histidine-containing phosphotransfer protein 2-like [Mangifera indica]|uniref:pseudo histidine-containing phosphotransfer protein 2-like n=1 Tax=Mangifera indica TaxID=29780 RepID=UPI001CFB9016|nr:pseudo histidine-containing phosphotransfer protein 2-like [Mangifera indica]